MRTWPSDTIAPHSGRRRHDAEPEEGQAGERDHGVAHVEGEERHDRPDRVGHDVAEQRPARALAERPGGLDVLEGPLHEDQAPREPRVLRPPHDRHRHDGVEHALAERRGDGHGQEQRRERQEEVRDAHLDLLHLRAGVRGDAAVDRAEGGGEEHHDQARRQRHAGADEHAREHVAAERVRPEGVLRRGRLEPREHVHLAGRVRGQVGRQQGDDAPRRG